MLDPNSQKFDALYLAYVVLVQELEQTGKLAKGVVSQRLKEAAGKQEELSARLLSALATSINRVDDASV